MKSPLDNPNRNFFIHSTAALEQVLSLHDKNFSIEENALMQLNARNYYRKNLAQFSSAQLIAFYDHPWLVHDKHAVIQWMQGQLASNLLPHPELLNHVLAHTPEAFTPALLGQAHQKGLVKDPATLMRMSIFHKLKKSIETRSLLTDWEVHEAGDFTKLAGPHLASYQAFPPEINAYISLAHQKKNLTQLQAIFSHNTCLSSGLMQELRANNQMADDALTSLLFTYTSPRILSYHDIFNPRAYGAGIELHYEKLNIHNQNFSDFPDHACDMIGEVCLKKVKASTGASRLDMIQELMECEGLNFYEKIKDFPEVQDLFSRQMHLDLSDTLEGYDVKLEKGMASEHFVSCDATMNYLQKLACESWKYPGVDIVQMVADHSDLFNRDVVECISGIDYPQNILDFAFKHSTYDKAFRCLQVIAPCLNAHQHQVVAMVMLNSFYNHADNMDALEYLPHVPREHLHLYKKANAHLLAVGRGNPGRFAPLQALWLNIELESKSDTGKRVKI